MIDLRTLLVLMAAADLMLAAAVWIGASRRLQDGLSHWASSLVARALALGLFAWAAQLQAGGAALAAALLALSITLQAAAIIAFDRRRLPAWVHTAVIAAVAVPLQALASEAGNAVFFGGIVFGLMLAVTCAVSWQLRGVAPSRSRGLLTSAFGASAAAFTLRGLAAVLEADPLRSLQFPSGFAAAALLVAAAAAIGSTFAFVLLHKERAEAEALRLATTDPLTGAYNRATFHDIAEREMSRAQRAGQPLSLVMIDIDHFRAVNEKHGHRVGDAVLQRFAEIVRSATRKEDIVVRFGGEEFLVLLPDVPGPGAVIVAGRIRRTVARAPLEVDGLVLPITASLGVAARLDEGPESLDDLLARADSALKLAKERGRNRVVALSLGRSIAA